MWVAAADLFRTRRTALSLVQILLISGFAVCCCGLVVFIASAKPGEQVYSSFYQADVLAGFIVIVLPLALAMYLGAQSRKEATFYGLVSPVFLLCLFMTYSRGGALSFMAGAVPLIAIFLALNFRRSLVRLLLFAALSSLLWLNLSFGKANLLVPGKAGSRLADLVGERDTSREARLHFWRAALRMAEERPLTGTGLATFGRHFSRFQEDVRFFSKYPHSLYLQLLAEGGWPLLLTFLALMGTLVGGVARNLRRAPRGSQEAVLTAGVLGACISSLLHAAVDVDWEFTALPLILLSLIAIAGRAGDWDKGYDADGSPVLEDAQAGGLCSFEGKGVRPRMALQFLCSLVVLVLIPLCASYFMAVQVYAFQGKILKDRKQTTQAEGALRMALRYDPFNAEIGRSLADLYLGRYMNSRDPSALAKALDVQTRAVSQDPHRAVNVHLLGKIYWEMGDHERARRCYEDALKLDSLNYPSFYNDLAAYRQAKGDTAGARSLYERALGLYSREAFGDMWYFRVDAVKEQLIETRLGLANLLSQQGDDRRAALLYREVLEGNPRQAAAWFGLGMIFFRQEAFADAIRALERVRALEPGFGLGRLLLGLSYEREGKRSQARAEIREALRIEPGLKEFPLLKKRGNPGPSSKNINKSPVKE
jgi:O-antigen ligase/tetratricopeptide (TPR) repeat protein